MAACPVRILKCRFLRLLYNKERAECITGSERPLACTQINSVRRRFRTTVAADVDGRYDDIFTN